MKFKNMESPLVPNHLVPLRPQHSLKHLQPILKDKILHLYRTACKITVVCKCNSLYFWVTQEAIVELTD